MFRSLWQQLKDMVYDTVNSVFRTQEEIDIEVETKFIDAGYDVIYDDEPDGAKARKRTFYSWRDAMRYAEAIPANYVTVRITTDLDETEDDLIYEIWVDES